MRSFRGMTFIDVIIGVALMLVVFTALATLLTTALKVSQLAKTHGVAIAIAESQMESLRSLSYASIGTVGGIPAGLVPQYATTTQNGLTMVTRTFIEYVDDPADGFAAADTNGIVTDYKRARVSTTYSVTGIPHAVVLISNFSPPGLETTNGGGTLKIAVVNASGAGVTGASVRIVNASSSPTVYVTTFSDATGIVYLPGAATSSQYQIYVSKNGYSSAQTYARDATNQNPTPAYLTVAANQTTTGTFAIDLKSSLTIKTFSPIVSSAHTDTFSTNAGVGVTSNTVVSAGALTLTGGPSTFAPSGSASSIVIAPPYLAAWSSASLQTTVPGGTTVRFQILDAGGSPLPDTAIPGNSGGLSSPVDLSGLSVTTYPSLRLSTELTTGSPLNAPAVLDWSISYLQGPVPKPNVAFTLTGTKAIGSTGASVPIIKTTIASSTSASSSAAFSVEWDSYALTLPSNDIISACEAPSYILAPASTLVSSLVLGTSTTNSLLLSAVSSSTALLNATVTLSRSGFSSTVTTDSCGSAYFGAVANAADYTLSVSKSGYTTYTESPFSVSGKTFYETSLSP